MTIFRSFYSCLILQVALTLAMVYAQDDQSGFISIDCGMTPGLNYTDKRTGLNYVSDAGFIDSGVSQKILPAYNSAELDLQLTTLTSFSQGTRNCYTLRPEQGKGNRYMIRARFTYGNYDLKGQPPRFDLYLGSDHWDTVDFSMSLAMDYEIIHLTSSDYIYVCLVNIGLGIPFISALELRLLDSTMYAGQLQSLALSVRTNLGTSETVRFEDDKYDRIWYALDSSKTTNLVTSGTVSSGPSTKEKVPSRVMSTAITIDNLTDYLYYSWEATDANTTYYMYIYLAEIEILKRNETRQFNIYLNGDHWEGPVSPLDHMTSTLYSSFFNSSSYTLAMNKTKNSTLPPILNAIELYTARQLLQWQTDDKDAAAIWSIRSTYRPKKSWQGDPCVPQASTWVGLNCSYNDRMNARIISLNLSSSGLDGEIAANLANLTMIQSLDLSYNNLTGVVPKFLASLDFLRILNLTGNNFTKPLPAELLAKSNEGLLLLSIEEISNQEKVSCPTGSCKKSKSNKVVIPVIATATIIFVILTALSILWIIKRRKKVMNADLDSIETRNRRFTFSEVRSITNSFNTVIGNGGFGTVFHGSIGDNQVAVKMLSESSAQGYREFQAEVHLLMNIHHRNITSLVGYCDEGSRKGIIYEYMANGNLGMHLFDRTSEILSWRMRLQIGLDAAQALEYMHHGCRPPIVHRDVKCSNILLNENFQAKLADFGLSRAFATEGATHVSTGIAGTPGYLDPEYSTTNRLTEKSDVYSFGVVLLELITGRMAISEQTFILNWVNSIVREGSVENIIDTALQGEFDIDTAGMMLTLARACVNSVSTQRPTMNNVVIDLKNCLEAEEDFHNAIPDNIDGSISLVPDLR
uniref:probable LRR receptor-like serine/threonine-protein kinase At1g05700 n=1 Tax=Erigeron canadensis TaxID=72917 RepID=UPI001CB9A23C|nr:probable LRR receptor-like serine/threonine-protein kinase At1g05700 [Erigeron canadensis]